MDRQQLADRVAAHESGVGPLPHFTVTRNLDAFRAKRRLAPLADRLTRSFVTQMRVRQESWQRIGGESPPRGRFSQPPRPRVMHEVLFARAAMKRSQGRPRAGYRAAKRV